MKKPKLLTIIAIVFVDMLGFSLILPLLPYYAGAYGASPTVIGLLVASYAAAQLVGSPLLGRLSDRYGRRPILLTSIAGTFLGFLLLAFAEPLGIQAGQFLAGLSPGGDPTAIQNALIVAFLFISRVLDGLTGGNISVAQAYITDITDEESRARGLGMIGAAFGLGFIIGPAVGGLLSTRGYAVPALAAAGLSATNLAMVAAFLPESLTADLRASQPLPRRGALNVRTLVDALRRPLIGPLLSTRFFFGLGFSTFQTIFPLYAQLHLGLSVQTTGLVLTYVGLLVVLVQGVAMGWLTSRFPETVLILSSTAMMSAALFAWAFVPNLLLLLIVLAPIALAGGTHNTVINSSLSKVSRPEEVGGMLGLSTSLESLTRVLSPSLGGALLGGLGAWAPGFFSAAILGALVPYVWRRIASQDLTYAGPGEPVSPADKTAG